MRTTLVAVGRVRRGLREVCDDYLRRIGRYGEIAEREVKEGPAARPVGERRRVEGERLLAGIDPATTVVALEPTGDPWRSEELATRLERWRLEARPVALLIGGPHGLDPAVLARANHRWSLGPLTLAHELARVVVLEQWYRAWTILRGEPYHK
ncbi:MAG: 23S rRNA (pseudouridine(1915)-N(3))-methyltransferase RlmH [Gemmatimonadales bacterium]